MAKAIGLTGGFGTGKSFAASILKDLGATIIDADKIAREAIKEGAPAYRKIVSAFGHNILRSDGSIDRRKLAKAVFSDKRAVKTLNAIVHPEVIRRIRQALKQWRTGDVVVIDAPLLIEAGLADIVDVLLVVVCSRDEQIRRCIKKFRIAKSDVRRRIANQIPIRRKVAMADFVIDNSGSRKETISQIRKIWKEILWR